MEKKQVSPEMAELISELNAKLKGFDDEFVCMFSVEGEGAFTLDMSAAGDKLTPGAPEKHDVRIDMSLKTLNSMLSGKLHPMIAYSTRKIKLTGDMQKALKLAGVLNG
ncbi:MAG: SCP2 sterol-binding domain-containing protein [Oscillospiraceae bacterium]|nr:SCP2 sterol-binding domain-containing protein [Oscillospiraceae bacterium]